MANIFSSMNTFKFVNALYKRAYYRMLKQHNVSSKREFISRSVAGTLETTKNWMYGHTGANAVVRANTLWECGIDLYGVRRYSSRTIKFSSFKKLNENSGLLAILITVCRFSADFTWAQLMSYVNYDKVFAAYLNWQKHGKPRNKDRSYSFTAYATNYYNSYRSWLNKIGAIKQTKRGYWKVTKFGKNMTDELVNWVANA